MSPTLGTPVLHGKSLSLSLYSRETKHRGAKELKSRRNSQRCLLTSRPETEKTNPANGEFLKSAPQPCAKLGDPCEFVSLSNICTGSKAKQVCLHGAGRGLGQPMAASGDGHCRQGPLQMLQGDGAKMGSVHACGPSWAWERMEGGAGGSYTVQSHSPCARLRKMESAAGNERTQQAVCAHTGWSLPFLHDRYTSNNPKQHGALDTTGGMEGGRGWAAGFVQGGTKDTWGPGPGRRHPLEPKVQAWEIPIVVFQVCVGPPWPRPPCLRLHVGGEVQCVPLQLGEGDWGVL